MDDCPEEKLIPIWLIVSGAVSLVRTVLSIGQRCCCKNKEEEGGEGGMPGQQQTHPALRAVSSILDTFNFAWFICGKAAVGCFAAVLVYFALR